MALLRPTQQRPVELHTSSSTALLERPVRGVAPLQPNTLDAAGSPDDAQSPEGPALQELLDAMDAMPSNPSIAMRILWIADDARANAPMLANTIELDPALTSRVLRIANSAYYSRGARVTNVARAVVSVGFATVQALATASMTGLGADSALPTEFWDHAARVAHASSLVSRHFDVGANDAFAAGLLHDLGEGVMCQLAPLVWAEIEASAEAGSADRLRAERDRFGMTHAEVGARILRAWHLPDTLVNAVGSHHSGDGGGPLGAAVVAGEAFADLVVGATSTSRIREARRILEAAGVTDGFINHVGPRLADESVALAEALR